MATRTATRAEGDAITAKTLGRRARGAAFSLRNTAADISRKMSVDDPPPGTPAAARAIRDRVAKRKLNRYDPSDPTTYARKRGQ